VVFKKGREGEAEVLLVSTKEGTRWLLPKGKVEQGERTLDAALREVREEGGVEGELVCPLDTISYWYYRDGVKRRKLVDFFLFRYRSGDPALHDWEVEDARFFPAAEALEIITFLTEKRVLETALKVIKRKGLDRG
jgi:8-oxo-dGTP pyrophosphatase MutT (NUDIX family)